LEPEEKVIARNFFLLTSKPTLFACNVAESDLAVVAKNDQSNAAVKYVDLVQDYAQHHSGTEAFVISARIESELADLSEEEGLEYLRGLGGGGTSAGGTVRSAR